MPSSAQQIDSYQETVWALLAFHHELVWDDESRKTLPRSKWKAHHTEKFTLSNGKFVTPDIRLLVPGGLPVGEIKMSFAAKEFTEKRKAELEAQLLKYDEALTELGAKHGLPEEERCLVLMVHQARVKSAARFVGELTGLTHKIGLIGYQRTDQVQTFITLDLREGEIVPEHKNSKLQAENVLVRADHLNNEYPDILFYDDEAPDLYVAEIFWTTVLANEAAVVMAKTGDLPKEVTIDAAEVATKLADGYSIKRLCKKARQSPSSGQMRRVLDMLVEMKLAKHVEGDIYEVFRKEIRDIRSSFEKRLADAKKRAAEREKKQKQKEAKKQEKEAEKAAKEAAEKAAHGEQLDLL